MVILFILFSLAATSIIICILYWVVQFFLPKKPKSAWNSLTEEQKNAFTKEFDEIMAEEMEGLREAKVKQQNRRRDWNLEEPMN